MELRADRVRQHSPSHTNLRIDAETVESVRRRGTSPAAVERRLDELAREWDIERALFAVTSINMLLGLTASVRDRRWIAWPFTVAAFQLQHALHGWCPPVSVLRRIGIRTRREIDTERAALKALRGDYTGPLGGHLDPEQALRAAAR